MPAELQITHRIVVQTPVIETVTDEIGAGVETIWPEADLTTLACTLLMGWLVLRLFAHFFFCPDDFIEPIAVVGLKAFIRCGHSFVARRQ